MENTCKKCNETKDVSLFVKTPTKKGYSNSCKYCTSLAIKKWTLDNKENIINKKKKHRLENIEKELARSRNYHINNKEII